MTNDRSFFGVFQLLFFLTGVPFALILWGMLDLPWHRATIVGIVAGIAIGMPLGFFLRASEVRFAYDNDRNTNFVARITMILQDLGYRVEHRFNQTITFKPTWLAGIMADRFVINLDNYDVMICGPKRHVDKLVKRLNLPVIE